MKDILDSISVEAEKLLANRFDYDTKYRSDKHEQEHIITLGA